MTDDQATDELADRVHAEIDDGGPAYPSMIGEILHGDRATPGCGMSLRDFFAGQALPQVLATQTRCAETGMPPTKDPFADAAEVCYSMADAMLAERNKVK